MRLYVFCRPLVTQKGLWIEHELAISIQPAKCTAIPSQQPQALTHRCILSDRLAEFQTREHINEFCITRINLDQIPYKFFAQLS